MFHQRQRPSENLYLSPEGADVWFIVDNERIPAHKLLLTSVSPWFKAMFYGLLAEQGDVNMSESATPDEFKEFLQFFYLSNIKLTEKNIAGVFDLVNQSMNDDFFAECEEYLIKHMKIANICWGLQLSLLYDAKKLQTLCERAISMNSKAIFESESFLDASNDVVYRIMSLDSLICDENKAFEACLVWAEASCQRNNLSSDVNENLRSQLKAILQQIRFGSMKMEDFGKILFKYPELFTKEESNEIIFIMSHIRGFKPKMFNAKPRAHQANSDERGWLCCQRFIKQDNGNNHSKVKKIESTIFSSSQPILLRGLTFGSRFGVVKIRIIEKNEENLIFPLFQNTQPLEYDTELARNNTIKAKLRNPFLIEPNVKYDIQLELENVSGYKRSILMQMVSVNQINIQFYPSDGEIVAYTGIIHTLYFTAFDKWATGPTNIFFRTREFATPKKDLMKVIGKNILKFLNILNFITSLMI